MIMMFHQLINSHYQKFVSYDNKSKKKGQNIWGEAGGCDIRDAHQ